MAHLAERKFAAAGRAGTGAAAPGWRPGGAPRKPSIWACCDGRHWPILKVNVRSCREMVSVNPGGEPERDDTGLPPVDIEIPDDARELDRDVQAYYRELRAERRRQRGRRLGWPRLAKDGIILPLLACCMILALITGTLLTVFTATSDHDVPALPHKPPGTGSAARNHPSGPASTRPGSARPGHSRPARPRRRPGNPRRPGLRAPGARHRMSRLPMIRPRCCRMSRFPCWG